MHQDGSLVVPNSSGLHSGLYYCLLRHTEGTTLWPYELHVGHNKEKNREDLRFRRDAAPEGEEQGQAGVSDGMFAGAVAASVLLTFVLGFGAGALTRARVLRCVRGAQLGFTLGIRFPICDKSSVMLFCRWVFMSATAQKQWSVSCSWN